jgi:hypothetical protein
MLDVAQFLVLAQLLTKGFHISQQSALFRDIHVPLRNRGCPSFIRLAPAAKHPVVRCGR